LTEAPTFPGALPILKEQVSSARAATGKYMGEDSGEGKKKLLSERRFAFYSLPFKLP